MANGSNENEKFEESWRFFKKIGNWEADGCDCKLCKDFVSNLGYVSLIWLWDIRLTVGIRKFCLNSSAKKYLLCQHLSA